MNPPLLSLLLVLPLGLGAQGLPPRPRPPAPPGDFGNRPPPPDGGGGTVNNNGGGAPVAAGQLGGPLAGLSTAQRAEFREGLAVFRHRENPESGLGPIFNDVSCVACHLAPETGGGSRRTVTRFGRSTDGGGFDPLASKGGSLLQERALRPEWREVIPAEANVVARRVSTPLFGAGLIEAIPDATLLAAAAAKGKPDGVKGRAAVITDVTTGEERVGRFGWKAQHATLLAFAADAFVNEMGITNRFFRADNAPNGDLARLDRADQVLDPEDDVDAKGKADVDRAADYMRLLAAPPRRGPLDSPLVSAGESLFSNLKCVACHTPSLKTGESSVAALSSQTVSLYSDLLLHDMGSLGDGIAQEAAGPREMRTAPLWGLGFRNSYLHDGRATTVDAAIRAHDGEAAPARDRYAALSTTKRNQLVAFLRSL